MQALVDVSARHAGAHGFVASSASAGVAGEGVFADLVKGASGGAFGAFVDVNASAVVGSF